MSNICAFTSVVARNFIEQEISVRTADDVGKEKNARSA
jgi:hypothetical protein